MLVSKHAATSDTLCTVMLLQVMITTVSVSGAVQATSLHEMYWVVYCMADAAEASSHQCFESHVGLGLEPDLGSIAPEAAPPGLREREGAAWAPPPGLKDWVRWSWLLLRCMGRTGLSIMLSCRDGIRLHHTHAQCTSRCYV